MDRKIIKNYIWNMIREVFVVLVPFILIPYVSRVMSVEELGIYNYSLSIVSYFTITAELGFPMLGRKEIPRAKTKEERNDIFLKIFFLKLIFGFLINIIYFTIIPNIMKPKIVYLLQGINTIAILLEISWYFVGIENFKRITIRTIFYKLFNLVLIFLCVKGENVLLKYTICMGLPTLFGNLIMFYKLDIKWKFPKFTLAEVKQYYKSAVILLIPTLLKSLYNIIDQSMLGAISTMREVGYYSQTFKLVNILVAIVYSIGVVTFPRLTTDYYNGNYDNVRKLMKEIITFVIHIGFPIIIGMICISDVFISWFYGAQYLALNELIIVAAPLIIINTLNNILCNQYLIVINKEDVLIKYTLIAIMVNVVGNIILIHKLGALGATVASIISESILLILSARLYKRTMHGTILESENIKCIISSLIMMICLILIKNILVSSDIFKTVVLVGCGIIIYVFMEILLRDSWIIKLIHQITDRLKDKI